MWLLGLWKGTGWSAIMYIAAIAGIDAELFDAAYVDGANRFQRIWYIILPSIKPLVIMQLTMAVGTILFFRGHVMLYLGEAYGLHYVVSSVGSIMQPGGTTVQRIRSVIINTLEETIRGNGNSWLGDLNVAAVPWLPEAAEEEETGLSNAA